MADTANPPAEGWNRRCPRYFFCWPNVFASYSLHTSHRPTLLRRICIIVILALHVLKSVFLIVNSKHISLGAFIVSLLFSILLFFFLCWALAVISDMRGERKVFGLIWNRYHFDAFLGLCFLLNVGWLAAWFLGTPWGAMWVWQSAVFLAMWGVAWVTTWPDISLSAAARV